MSEKEISEVLSRMGNEVVSLVATSRNLGENYAKLVELLGAPPGNGHKEKVYKETGGLRDRVILVHRDKTGKVIATRDSGWQDHKCLTNTGFAEITALLLPDVGGIGFDFIGIGTGVVAADPTNTDLGALVKRKAGDGTQENTAVADDTAQLTATFSKAVDGLTGADAITESDVMNSAALGTELCRQVFDPLNINWDSSDTLLIKWLVQAKQGA